MALENSHLYREIHEQPAVLRQLITREHQVIRRLAAAIQGARGRLCGHRRVRHQRQRRPLRPVPFRRGQPPGRGAGDAQPASRSTSSRRASATRWSSASARAARAPTSCRCWPKHAARAPSTAAITNFPDSDLGRQTEHVITLHAGDENRSPPPRPTRPRWLPSPALSAELGAAVRMQDALEAVPDAVAAHPEALRRDRRGRRALSLHERMRGDWPRLQLCHRLRDWRSSSRN